MKNIPFYDLRRLHQSIRLELKGAAERVLKSGFYVLGPEVSAFENAFGDYCGTTYAVGTGNGLDALTLVLRAMNVGAGDEVIVPAQTFIATWLSVSAVGAIPVPVEVEEHTANLDPCMLEAAITGRTKAIIVVHLFGRPAQMNPILDIAHRHGLKVIEDAAQAHGALWNGRKAGSLADAAIFSFYPSKNLGGLGDGGAVCTSDATVARRTRQIGNYGSAEKYVHSDLGVNSRLDELQAALLLAKLPMLDTWNEARVRVANRYNEGLRDLAPHVIVPPLQASKEASVWHLYVIQSPQRDKLRALLEKRQIGTAVHYPKAPGCQAAYRHLNLEGAFPVAERLAARSLSQPMAPYLTDAEIDAVIEAVRESVATLSVFDSARTSSNR